MVELIAMLFISLMVYVDKIIDYSKDFVTLNKSKKELSRLIEEKEVAEDELVQAWIDYIELKRNHNDYALRKKADQIKLLSDKVKEINEKIENL